MEQHVQNYGGMKKYCCNSVVNSIARARNVLRQWGGGRGAAAIRVFGHCPENSRESRRGFSHLSEYLQCVRHFVIYI